MLQFFPQQTVFQFKSVVLRLTGLKIRPESLKQYAATRHSPLERQLFSLQQLALPIAALPFHFQLLLQMLAMSDCLLSPRKMVLRELPYCFDHTVNQLALSSLISNSQ